MKFTDIFKSGKQKQLDKRLLEAIRSGNEADAVSALDEGADSNAKDAAMPAIVVAAGKQQAITVAALINRGADVNAGGIKEDGTGERWTALMAASVIGSKEVVHLLLAADAKVDMPDAKGVTALMLASANGRNDVMEVLLRKGADMDKKCDSGYTPLLFATKGGHLGAIRILLARGAVVECKDKQNTTPLMVAAQMGFTEIAALLLQHGADKSYRNLDQKNAAGLAREYRKTEISDLFLKYP